VRITSNGWAAVAGAGLMFAMAIQTRSIWMQVVGSALAGLLGISWLVVIVRRPGLTVTVSRPVEVTVGVPFDVDVRVRNSGRRPSPPLRVTSELAGGPDLLAPVTVYLDPVAPSEQTVLSVPRVPERRGAARRSTILLDAIAPFGFFTSRQRVDVPHGLWIAPRTVTPIDVPGVLGAQVDGSGPMGPGLDVRGVREWRPGDAVRHVHWRSTARTGQLAVLDYGEPTVGTIGVLVAGTTAGTPEPQFEAALALAAATAMRAIEDGVVVVIAVEDGTGHHVEALTQQSWHRVFAELKGVGLPAAATFDRLLAEVGLGGVLVVALGHAASAGFLDHIEYATSVAGAGVLDTADYVDGRR
jgi:uncharacterized protein (DUF58 family)